MTLKELCFFSDLQYGHTGDIRSFIRDRPFDMQDKAARYLRSGIELSQSFTIVKNVFTGEIIGPLSMLTDGEWIWGNDLVVYVEENNLRLPVEFMSAVQLWDGSKFNVDLDKVI